MLFLIFWKKGGVHLCGWMASQIFQIQNPGRQMKKELSKYWQCSGSRTVGRKIMPGFQSFLWGGSHQAHLIVLELDLKNKPVLCWASSCYLTWGKDAAHPLRAFSLSYIIFQVCLLLCVFFFYCHWNQCKDPVSVCLKMHFHMYKCKYAFNLPSHNTSPTHLLLNRCCLHWSIWLLLAFCTWC